MDAQVVVVGGGYGGVAVAQALDPVAEVVLIEPRDTFVHNVAALRALVDPAWVERIFLPYDRLLTRGRVVRDRVTRAEPGGITLHTGGRIFAEFLVLATGSRYPFPAKVDLDDHALSAARIRVAGAALAHAERLLLGAGPVGLELAGEIKAAWPSTAVTILDPADHILTGGLPDELRAELRRQLDDLGVELVLGTALREPPPSEVGQPKTFTATTTSGREITADIWFRCYGVTPVSDYLTGALATARRPDGHVTVTDQLRLPGQRHVFAIGDLTAIPEAKMAGAAARHAQVVATNIQTVLTGTGQPTRYRPAPAGIVLPLGPRAGASYRADLGLLDAASTARIKGEHLMIDRFATLLGVS